MKTYQKINTINDVKIGDVLLEFYPNSNEVWHKFKVIQINKTNFELQCPSRAIIYVSQNDLIKESYFKN
jgi:hypothetical protein